MIRFLQMALLCTTLSAALLGCGGGGGGGSLDPITIPAASFAGSYSGTFSGSPFHFNAWSMYVKSTGAVTGHTNNDLTGGDFSGSIDSDGKFHVDQPGGTGGDVALDGTIDVNGNITGTWTNSTKSTTGSFSGTRETVVSNRFTLINGTIRDSVTNLTWLANADCFGLQGNFDANSKAVALASGQCGLTDGSAAGAWRLPTVDELLIFVDDGYLSSSLSSVGFSNVRTDYPYWSATTNAYNINEAWLVSMSSGFVSFENMGFTNSVLPVRTGP